MICRSRPLLQGLDVVVHAAAPRSRHGADAATYRASNVELVERAMRAAAAGGRAARFVLVSCVGVYGFPSRLPVTEDHPYAPRTLQAGHQGRGRDAGAPRGARARDRALVIVRPTTVYGPGDRDGMLEQAWRTP